MAVRRQAHPLRLVSARLGISLASMLIMLAVVNLTVQRMRQQGGPAVPPALPPVADRVVAPDNAPPPEENAGDAEPDPVADRDAAEAEAFGREAQALMDRSTLIHAIENPALYRLLRWVSAQKASDLVRRAPEEAVFQDLVGHPDASRGKLVEVELTIKLVRNTEVPAEKAGGAERVYELWGWPTSGRGWFYVVVTPELPKGFPVAGVVDEMAKVCGYFLKLQGYEPADAKPYARPLVAPLIVGRVVAWQPPAPPPPSGITLPRVALGVGGAALLFAIGYWLWRPRRGPASTAAATPDWPAARAPFDRANQRELPEGPESKAFDWVHEEDGLGE